MKSSLVLLDPRFDEKIWGSEHLEPWFESSGRKIGEVCFPGPEGDNLPLLVKFIFTTESLSVQVHPDDAYARAKGARGGKTEMWYVLRAEPGARIGAGFSRALSRKQLRAAAESGEIGSLLGWWPAREGQVWFLPPGTVHALGAGLVVCEIQVNNQITYRLFDFGRGRQLHLDDAVAVADTGPYPGPSEPAGSRLAECPYFVVERIELKGETEIRSGNGFELLVVLQGEGRAGESDFRRGQVWYVPPGVGSVICSPGGARLLRVYEPS